MSGVLVTYIEDGIIYRGVVEYPDNTKTEALYLFGKEIKSSSSIISFVDILRDKEITISKRNICNIDKIDDGDMCNYLNNNWNKELNIDIPKSLDNNFTKQTTISEDLNKDHLHFNSDINDFMESLKIERVRAKQDPTISNEIDKLF